MMKYLNLLPFMAFLFVGANTFSQTPADKTVSLTVSGQGKTSADAQQVALRSAIEQAFGVFISSKTEILNDQMVSDQITSISNGNIQSFKVLAESQLPSGDWAITLTAIVSITKLTSFVQAKGVSVDIQGELFAMNILQQELNEKAELIAVRDMIVVLKSYLMRSLDFEIKVGEPVAENSRWKMPVEVTGKANKNMYLLADYMMKTLTALSMTESEILTYKKLQKGIYVMDLFYEPIKTFPENPYFRLSKNGKYAFRPSSNLSKLGWAYCNIEPDVFPAKIFFLRVEDSLAELEKLFLKEDFWFQALENFKVDTGLGPIITIKRGGVAGMSREMLSTYGENIVILDYVIRQEDGLSARFKLSNGEYTRRDMNLPQMNLIHYLNAQWTLGSISSSFGGKFVREINSDCSLVSIQASSGVTWSDNSGSESQNRYISLILPVEGKDVVKINWNDLWSLDELRRLKKYKISSLED